MGDVGPAGLAGLKVSLLPGCIDTVDVMLLRVAYELTSTEHFTAVSDIYGSI